MVDTGPGNSRRAAGQAVPEVLAPRREPAAGRQRPRPGDRQDADRGARRPGVGTFGGGQGKRLRLLAAGPRRGGARREVERVKYGLYLRNMGPQSTPRDRCSTARAPPRRRGSTISGSSTTSPSRPTTRRARAAATSTRSRRSPTSPARPRASASARACSCCRTARRCRPRSGWRRSRSCRPDGCGSASVPAGWRPSSARSASRAHGAERITDETLDFLERCFASDEVEANGQPFLFLPRPPRPPIFVGGAPPHALRRAVRYGDGWMPTGGDARRCARPIANCASSRGAAGKPAPEVVADDALPLDDRGARARSARRARGDRA